MRKAKKILIVVFVFSVLCFCACGKDDKQAKDKKKAEEVVEENQLPNEKQMAKDIDTFGANTISLATGDYTLETSSIKIDKAKKETEQYLVYCTATQESDMFKASNSYVMTYNFYDIGGWVLDECIVEKVDMIPKKTIPEEEARYYASGLNNFTSLECTGSDKKSDTEYVYHYVGKYVYAYMDEIHNIDVTCTYHNEYGWYVYGNTISKHKDWSKFCGSWYGEHIYDVKNATFNVKEVDTENGFVKFDLSYTRTDGKDEVIKLKDLTASISTDLLSTQEEMGMEYIATTTIDAETYNKDVIMFWGKDKGMLFLSVTGRVLSTPEKIK